MGSLPAGPDTTCKSGKVVLKASDAGEVLSADDFLFETAEDVANTIVTKQAYKQVCPLPSFFKIKIDLSILEILSSNKDSNIISITSHKVYTIEEVIFCLQKN